MDRQRYQSTLLRPMKRTTSTLLIFFVDNSEIIHIQTYHMNEKEKMKPFFNQNGTDQVYRLRHGNIMQS